MTSWTSDCNVQPSQPIRVSLNRETCLHLSRRYTQFSMDISSEIVDIDGWQICSSLLDFGRIRSELMTRILEYMDVRPMMIPELQHHGEKMCYLWALMTLSYHVKLPGGTPERTIHQALDDKKQWSVGENLLRIGMFGLGGSWIQKLRQEGSYEESFSRTADGLGKLIQLCILQWISRNK
ncbi:hypothetical protein Tco_0074001 [Tanacetum coccineum]